MPRRLVDQTWTIRTISPLVRPWNLTELRKQGLEATAHLRDYVKTKGKIERDGTDVTLDWIQIDGENIHLHAGIRIADAPTAQIVLCYVTRDDEKDDLAHSFAYVLVHGDRKCYEILLEFVEQTFGCSVGVKSFRPSSARITRSWIDTISTAGASQMELTFGTPRSVINISEITLSIPPTCFMSLLLALELKIPPERANTIPIGEEMPGMVLKALQTFIFDTFHMDVRAFPIIRVANSKIIFGANGRVKMVDEEHVEVLAHIKEMVECRIPSRRSVRKQKRPKTDAAEEDWVDESDDESDGYITEDGDDDDDGRVRKKATADEQIPNAAGIPIGPHLDGNLEDKEMFEI